MFIGFALLRARPKATEKNANLPAAACNNGAIRSPDVLCSNAGMPNHNPGLHFVVQMALRNALKLVRGLRKQISEAEESVMTGKLLDEIALSNYEIVKRAGRARPCV